MRTRSIVLIAHNLRSCHNAGSLLRTADGIGVAQVYLTGYSPYPITANDTRLPHLSQKITKQIHKTALGAETSVKWNYSAEIAPVFHHLRNDGYTIAALEQAPTSLRLPEYNAPDKIALLLGREVEGVEPEVLAQMDITLEIPMFGAKESFNVAQAAAMALYHLTFF